jgi:hypothetical protein
MGFEPFLLPFLEGLSSSWLKASFSFVVLCEVFVISIQKEKASKRKAKGNGKTYSFW